MNDAYDEGYKAGYYGEYPTNPYEEGTDDYKLWNMGYKDGSNEMK
jgi:hypothetical protein